VSTILFKTMDRMGRDYLRVGLYREMFREKGIRIIAVTEGYDSSLGDDDLSPFREIMAEWYARDTSKKIKSAYATKGRSGKPTANTTPFGFIKDPNDINKWLVDEPAASVVKRIFQLAMEGKGVHQIARVLTEDKVERPSYYRGTRGHGTQKNFLRPRPAIYLVRHYRWSDFISLGILRSFS